MRNQLSPHPAEGVKAPSASTPPIVLALRTPEAAAALAISSSQLETLGRTHRLPCVKLGGCTVWPVDALRQFLSERGLTWVQQQAAGDGGSDQAGDAGGAKW
jgi:predicted RNA-binding Zn ribbon-like protein